MFRLILNHSYDKESYKKKVSCTITNYHSENSNIITWDSAQFLIILLYQVG